MEKCQFNCGVCLNFKTNRADEWEYHIKKHKCRCSDCGKVFYKPQNLRNHINYVHKNETWVRPVYGTGEGENSAVFSTKYWEGTQIKLQETSLGLYEYNYLINFKHYTKKDNKDLHSRIIFVHKVLEDIVKHFKKLLVTKKDKIQLIFNSHPSILAAPFASKFCNRHTFTVKYLKERAATLLNSNQFFVLNENFHLTVKLYKSKIIKGGHPKHVSFFDDYHTALKQKRSVVYLNKRKNNSNLCFAESLILGIAKINVNEGTIDKKVWKKYVDQRSILLIKSRLLQKSTGIPFNTHIKLKHIKKFEKILKDYQIIVLKGPLNKVIYSSIKKCEKKLYVLYYKDHYIPILNYRSFIAFKYTCPFCNVNCNQILYKHICSQKCFRCHQKKHKNSLNIKIKCSTCKNMFYDKQCYFNHKETIALINNEKKSVCDVYKFCDECGCSHNVALCKPQGSYFCNNCQINAVYGHNCYMNPRKGKMKKRGIIVFDIESRFSKNFFCFDKGVYLKHIPNLVVSRKICDSCLIKFNIKCDSCEIRFFKYDNCIKKFIKYILKQNNIIVISHNGAKYDHVLLVNELTRQCHIKQCHIKRVPNANSILAIDIDKKIMFRDSLLFFRTALKNLPKTFGYDADLSKPPFPFYFNKIENYNYCGCYPDIKYYHEYIEKLSSDDKNKFYEWYKQVKYFKFDFWTQMKEYCLNDVNILSNAVVVFRKMFDYFKIDVFFNITLAQTAFRIFRDNFIKPDTIQILPENRDNTSLKAESFLRYCENVYNISIQRSGYPCEYKIPGTKYKVDGYHAPSKTVYEYLGCYWHGSLFCDCYKSNDIVGGGRTAGYLAEKTQKRHLKIKQKGYKLRIIPDCVWSQFLKKEKIDIFKNFPPSLNTRSALSGGRVEVFSIFFDSSLEGKKGRYLDINSLYPFVQKYEKYPIGDVEFLSGDEIEQNINLYFGTASVKILPPKKLKIPVLPLHVNNKLMFSLCKTCAEMLNKDVCTHTDIERSLLGSWCTEELKLACLYGYTIEHIYQVYNYKQNSSNVFKEYIDYFLKIKTESKGYPPNVTTKTDKINYIKKVYERENIKLNPKNIKANSGMYYMAKLLLNSLWGKLCQKPNLRKQDTVYSDSEFEALWDNYKINILDVHCLDFNSCLVNYEYKDQYTPTIASQNCILGSFVASYGRIRLYKILDLIGNDNLLYCDTDSVIFKENDSEITDKLKKHVGISNFLGELGNELTPDDNYINLFIGLSAKSYAYKTFKPDNKGVSEFVKNKGFTLNLNDENEPCNLNSFINLFKNSEEKLKKINLNHFVKNPYTGNVYMKKLEKNMCFNYNKRYIFNTVNTLPYGYNHKS